MLQLHLSFYLFFPIFQSNSYVYLPIITLNPCILTIYLLAPIFLLPTFLFMQNYCWRNLTHSYTNVLRQKQDLLLRKHFHEKLLHPMISWIPVTEIMHTLTPENIKWNNHIFNLANYQPSCITCWNDLNLSVFCFHFTM